MKKIVVLLVLMGVLLVVAFQIRQKYFYNSDRILGEPLDSLNGVKVYYNGSVGNVGKRNLSVDNYNLGMEYQCVEFVKRYYYQRFQHKMPDSYGNAKDFFDHHLVDGSLNEKRNLVQFTNPSISPPRTEDLVVYSPTIWNRYGHVAIVSRVSKDSVEIIQQNPGPNGSSRERYALKKQGDKWTIDYKRIYGWLRMEADSSGVKIKNVG